MTILSAITDMGGRTRHRVGSWEVETLSDALAHYDDDYSPWLVEQILHESVTVMASPPKAGKSAFAVGLIAALSCGSDEFLGQPLHGSGSSVIFTTDAGSTREYTKRLSAHGANPNSVSFIDGRRMAECEDGGWLGNVDALKAHIPNLKLVIVDNLLGVLGDAAPGERTNRFYMRLQDFNRHDVAVLVLHHTAVADETGYGMGKRPQGGRSNETSARQILMLLPPGNSAPSNVLCLTAYGNDMTNGKDVRYVELQDLQGSPTVIPSEWKPKQPEKRTQEKYDRGKRIAGLAEQYPIEAYEVNGKPSRNALAKVLFEDHGKELRLAKMTIRDNLKRLGLP